MRLSVASFATAALLLPLAFPAGAAVMTYDVTVTAPFNDHGNNVNTGNYGGGSINSNSSDGDVPISPVTASFLVTLDPTLTYSDATSITGSINVPFGSLVFNYSPTTPTEASDVAGELVIGGSGGTGGGGCPATDNAADCVQIDPASDDFYVQILDFTTSPTLQQVGYTNVNSDPGGGTYDYTLTNSANTVTATVVPPTSVPEPASLALLGTALAGFGVVRRRRRKTV